VKKYNTIYNFDSITYWPYYAYSLTFAVFIVILSSASFIIALSIMINDKPFDIWAVGILFFLCVGGGFSLVPIFKLSTTKFHINYFGVSISSRIKNKNCCISWKDVYKICYRRDFYYGKDSCIIYYKIRDITISDNAHAIALPLRSVHYSDLIKFFPKHIEKT